MARLVVRNIESEVKPRLQRRARRHGRSMEQKARHIQRDAAKLEDTPARGLGTEIASLFKKIGLNADIAELRGHEIKPTSLV